LLQKGASLKQIADFLGHRSVRSVDVYARLDIRSLRKVAAYVISDLYEAA
jgi:site-specific recombinase XerD